MNQQNEFEHAPFVGKHYESNRRLCIVGYSHYIDASESDSPSLTNEVMAKVLVDREFGHTSFWRAIASYCRKSDLDADGVCEFWNSVLFFNFLPQAVGTEMFARGKKAQVQAAGERFLRILRSHSPSRVLVFSTKAFEALPTMEQEANGGNLHKSEGNQWGTYAGISTRVIGLRHPLFASKDMMKQRVAAALCT